MADLVSLYKEQNMVYPVSLYKENKLLPKLAEINYYLFSGIA